MTELPIEKKKQFCCCFFFIVKKDLLACSVQSKDISLWIYDVTVFGRVRQQTSLTGSKQQCNYLGTKSIYTEKNSPVIGSTDSDNYSKMFKITTEIQTRKVHFNGSGNKVERMVKFDYTQAIDLLRNYGP